MDSKTRNLRDGNDESQSKSAMRNIRICGGLKVQRNLAVGGDVAVSYEHAQQDKVLQSNDFQRLPTRNSKSQVQIHGPVEAGSMQVDVQQSFHVTYAEQGKEGAPDPGSQFHMRVMLKDEDPCAYAAELQALAAKSSISDDLVVAQFIHGQRCEEIKRKLRAKANLTLDRAIGCVEAWSEAM